MAIPTNKIVMKSHEKKTIVVELQWNPNIRSRQYYSFLICALFCHRQFLKYSYEKPIFGVGFSTRRRSQRASCWSAGGICVSPRYDCKCAYWIHLTFLLFRSVFSNILLLSFNKYSSSTVIMGSTKMCSDDNKNKAMQTIVEWKNITITILKAELVWAV